MNKHLLPASILIAAVLISGSVLYSSGVKKQPASLIDSNKNEAPEVLLQQNDEDFVLGDKNAPVTVVVYSDPSCPFCGAAAGENKEVMDYLKQNDPTWTAPIPGLIDNYINSGKAKLIFRYYPGHGTGELSMGYLYCANEQGKFWELHNEFFANQNSIDNKSVLSALAGSVGLDAAKLNSCLEKGDYTAKLKSDVESGRAVGVKGTPAFFVNGQKFEGAYSFATFKLVIDELLK